MGGELLISSIFKHEYVFDPTNYSRIPYFPPTKFMSLMNPPEPFSETSKLVQIFLTNASFSLTDGPLFSIGALGTQKQHVEHASRLPNLIVDSGDSFWWSICGRDVNN
jgi:hypothetical protein